MLNLQERKQLHKEFMVAAFKHVLTIPCPPVNPQDGHEEYRLNMASSARSLADAALIEYEARWEGEEGPKQKNWTGLCTHLGGTGLCSQCSDISPKDGAKKV